MLGDQMLSGNTADVTWNKTWVDQLDHDFPENFWKDKCYIADSALFSAETIQRLRQTGMHWLGRLPARFALCGALKTQAWAQDREAWQPLRSNTTPSRQASVYHVQTFDVTFLGEPARAFVYHSSALDKKKEHTLQRDIKKERARYDALKKKLAPQTLATAQEAAHAASQLLESVVPVWYTVKPVVEEQALLCVVAGARRWGHLLTPNRSIPSRSA